MGPEPREWHRCLVKARFSEQIGIDKGGERWPAISEKEVRSYEESLSPSFETQIYLRPTPILVDVADVTDVITVQRSGKSIRIYPPFSVNEKSETSGAFEDILVPEGGISVKRIVKIPSRVFLF